MIKKQRDIDNYVEVYKRHDFEKIQLSYRRKKVLERLNLYPHKNVLEIGCGFEPIFKYFDDFETMTIIDPGIEFIENAKKISQGETRIKCIHGFFEEKATELSLQNYDFIIVSALLHELERPDVFLKVIKSICALNTIVHINVPNAYSIHRILAQEMGLINEVTQMSDTQIKLQQHTTFSMESLTNLINTSHFQVVGDGGYFVKPFTQQQMMTMLRTDIIDTKVLDGLYNLTKYIPEYGSEIFVDCMVM